MEKKLVHCSYHKCLTVYFMRVMSMLYDTIFRFSDGYKHYNSRVDRLYQELGNYKVVSVNNHCLDFDELDQDARVSRFIRDPRDLVVSGYLYHKKGTEVWSNVADPTPEDWKVVNGVIPKDMPEGQTYTSYLNSLSKEEGLKTEIEFRSNHFQSMMQWPTDDDRIKLFRYEDIMGNEPDVYEELLAHYGVTWVERKLGRYFGNRYSAKKRSDRSEHIRNPSSGQWQKHFTPQIEAYFNDKYGKLLERYGYD